LIIALPIAATVDLLPEIARHAPPHALVTDACSTKVRIAQAADELFPMKKVRSSSVVIRWPAGNSGNRARRRRSLPRTHLRLIAKSSEAVVAGVQPVLLCLLMNPAALTIPAFSPS